MATVAVFDPTFSNRLVSVGDDPGAVPAPLLKALTAFADATPPGSPVDFSRYVWNSVLLRFDLRVPPAPSPGQTQADALISKATTLWTTNDLATAFQLVLKTIRGQL